MKKPQITMPTSSRHELLISMAIRRAQTPSRRAMLETIGRQIETYGTMTSAQLGLAHATLTSTR